MVNVKFERHGGALIIRVSGFYKPATARKVRDLTNAELQKAGAVKALLDLRKAVWLMTEDEWDALAAGEFAHQPIEAALGILGNELDSATIWRATLSMIKYGRTRVPFTSAAHAAHWLGVPSQSLSPLPEFQPGPPGASLQRPSSTE